MNKVFEKLYKAGGKGDIQEWEIRVEGNKIITRWGKMGCNIQESAPTVITEGKNLGKKNATTPEQQAMLEAQAEWEKKQKRGYVTTLDAAKSGDVSDMIEGGVWPMLAEKYRDYPHKVTWPCYGQPKLNGHRMVGIVDDAGKCTLWSRTRKPINSVPHIVAAIESLGLRSVILDGEAYNHDLMLKHGLEAITHIMRQQKPLPEHVLMGYHVYDIIDLKAPFKDRAKFITKDLVDAVLNKTDSYKVEYSYNICVGGTDIVYTPNQRWLMALNPVKTIELDDEDDMLLAFEQFLQEGYEGLMVRNSEGLYMGHPTHRSKDLLKVKKFDDAEFKVTGVKEGTGKMAGHAIFICVTDKGVSFDAKMKGELANLRQYWEHPERAIGKMLTVKYQGFTKKGAPWFPVALQFRAEL